MKTANLGLVLFLFLAAACASKQQPPAANAGAPSANTTTPATTTTSTTTSTSTSTSTTMGTTAVAVGAEGTKPIAVTVLPAPAGTPAATPAPGRAAQAILDDAVKAIGGEAWTKHKNVRMKLTMTFQGIGITGQGERFATKADKSLVVTDLPGIGTIREGSNGKVHWSQDPVNGLRILDGAEAEQARIESVWNAEQRLGELYAKIEATSQPGPNGVTLECVVLTPKLGKPTTNCYDPDTHLQVLQKGIRATPQGDTPFTSTLKDWRDVGGIKMAFGVDTQAGPITFAGKISDVKFDTTLDDKMFEPPSAPGAASGGTGAATKPASKKKKEPAPTAK